MPYYRCPECALTVQSLAGRFTARACPRCLIPLTGTDEIYTPARPCVAVSERFEPEPAAAPAARRALDALLEDLDPDEHQVAALLTSELVANSVEHARAGLHGSVRLDVALSDELLRVEVADDGAGFVPAARGDDSPLDSHWGLHLVEELADRWGVTAKPPTMVWFELDLRVAAVSQATGAGYLV